jgi:hypothetical protein
MLRRVGVVTVAAGLIAAGVSAAPASGAPTGCDPFTTPPAYNGTTPTDEDVLGFSLGSQEATAGEINEFLTAVDGASERVTTGTAARSVGGLPLRYAIVGNPDRLTAPALAQIRTGAACGPGC